LSVVPSIAGPALPNKLDKCVSWRRRIRSTVPPRADSTIALYTDLVAQCINSRRSSSTVDRMHSPRLPSPLFISHSPAVGVPWRNLLSPEFGAKFQGGGKYSDFCKYSTCNFLIHRLRETWMQKASSIHAAVSIQYRRVTDRRMDGH